MYLFYTIAFLFLKIKGLASLLNIDIGDGFTGPFLLTFCVSDISLFKYQNLIVLKAFLEKDIEQDKTSKKPSRNPNKPVSQLSYFYQKCPKNRLFYSKIMIIES